MSKVKLSYFDFSGGRGEACRLALFLGGVDFVDDRIDPKEWPSKKSSTPYGSLPVLEIEGKGTLAQSNAILGLIGSQHDLLPENFFEAAIHHGILNSCEDFNFRVANTLRIEDEELKKKSREELAEGYIKEWAKNIDKQIDGPFIAGEKISVADLKLYTVLSWIKKGVLDYIPASTFDDFTRLNGLFTAVSTHPKVIEWYKDKN